MKASGTLGQVLDLARWAPSGDNTQCWRFEIVADDHFVVHGFDTREHCVYDLDGHPSQISFGALLETVAIAASAHGLRADITRRTGCVEARPEFDVRLVADATIAASPLLDAIKTRTVQRRPMSTRPLTADDKAALVASIGPGYTVTWMEGLPAKFAAARLMFNNARLRLTMPEAFETHRKIIHWGVDRSPDRVPDKALGVDAATLVLMKWAMVSWKRMATMNAISGTWAPRLQMDLVPGLACAAHFVLKAKAKPVTIDDYVAAGRAVQRFWLTLTARGLYMQPEMTPLIFSKYVRENTAFTTTAKLHGQAEKLRAQADQLIFTDALFPVYMGRLGAGPAPKARSERRSVEDLLKRD
jgi:hypothetical protein